MTSIHTSKVRKFRNPLTNRDKFYELFSNKLIAYYEPPDTCGDSELTITEYGAIKGYCSYNNQLFDKNNSEFVFKKKQKE